MDYSTLSLNDRLNGYQNRIQQLEIEHFSNSVYAEEAQLIGATSEAKDFEKRNETIETRIDYLEKKKKEILTQIEELENGDNGTV